MTVDVVVSWWDLPENVSKNSTVVTEVELAVEKELRTTISPHSRMATGYMIAESLQRKSLRLKQTAFSHPPQQNWCGATQPHVAPYPH